MELSEMLSTVGEHKHGTREKRLELARELQAVLGERPSSTGVRGGAGRRLVLLTNIVHLYLAGRTESR